MDGAASYGAAAGDAHQQFVGIYPLVLGLALPVKGLDCKNACNCTHQGACLGRAASDVSHCCGNTVTRRATAAELTSWVVCYTASGCLWGKAHIAAVIVWLAWNVASLWDDSNVAATCRQPIDWLCGCMWAVAVAMWLA